MNFSDSKKKLALAGALCGVIAAVLAYFGNPANMAICVACFIRDTAGALKMHQAAVVQYVRPEIIGIVVGYKRISFYSRLISDDTICTWNRYHDWVIGIFRMSA